MTRSASPSAAPEDEALLRALGEGGELETVDLAGVVILRAGGPYFGQGSPPEGDFYDEAALDRIAENTGRMIVELRPPNKVGHSKDQALLSESGLDPAAPDYPAAGWLENVRRDGDRLLADIKRVPKLLADLISVGAFRTRSVELGYVVPQDGGGEPVGPVVRGLAWLGARLPAVRTLDDIAAWYAEAEAAQLADGSAEEPETTVDHAEAPAGVSHAAGAVVWDQATSLQGLRDLLRVALNPTGSIDGEWGIEDVSDGRALVCNWRTDEAFVVPFTVTGDGADRKVELAPSADWTRAERAWVAYAAGVDDAAVAARRPAAEPEPAAGEGGDTSAMSNLTFTEEQTANAAQTLGVDPSAVTPEALLAALSKPAVETPGVQLSEDALATLRAQAAAGERAMAERTAEKRDALIAGAVSGFKLDPADIEKWTARYNENPTLTTELLAELPVREELKRAYGADGDGLDKTNFDRDYEAWGDLLGTTADERVNAGSR